MKKTLTLTAVFTIPALVVFYFAWNWLKCDSGLMAKRFGTTFNEYRKQHNIPLIETYFTPYYDLSKESNDWRDTAKVHVHTRKLVKASCSQVYSETDYYLVARAEVFRTTHYPDDLSDVEGIVVEYTKKVEGSTTEEPITKKAFDELLNAGM